MSAVENKVALPLRNHTILGVCEGIGEDFGFNPIFLRVPFAAMVLWSPLAAIGAYLALGGVVLLSRVVFPNEKAAAELAEVKAEPSSEHADHHDLPLAA
jgi:phage shock protein PspC (stress-responsive transcriptional regulator)